MRKSQSASEIDDEATAWAVRAEAAEGDPAREAELAAWLAGDPRRQGALLRAQAALSFLDRGRALAGADGPRVAAAARRRVTRRAMLAGGGLAVAAGAAGVAILSPERRRYDTGLGEIRRVPLGDGSLVAINTRSALDVAMGQASRRVELRAGEAWFEVAKDPRRPFVVATGPVRVRAVGTAFSVRREGEDADVLVTEGVVETWVAGASGARTRVAAGSKIVVGPGRPAVSVEAPEAIERILSWRTGQIALDGESLADAAREFNRYNARQILIDDPSLAQARFVGLFRTNDPDSFASAVALTMGARVTREPGYIRLGRGA